MRIGLILLGFIMCLPACGLTEGAFSAVGTEFANSSTHIGCLSIVQGYSVKNGHVLGGQKNLIYLMIICSDVKAGAIQSGNEGIDGDPMSRPIIYYEWQTANGAARVEFNWNTRSDSISIQDQTFDRTKGNVFFIERKSNGKLVAKQCGTLGQAASFSDLARQVRQTLPGNELVLSSKFAGVDK